MKDLATTEYSIVAVQKINTLNSCYFILETDALKSTPCPGQFYLLKSKEKEQGLHIPISIYHSTDEALKFMVKIVGEGTNELAKLKIGEGLRLLGPLGNSFPIAEHKNVLLISGGIGYAPLFYLKEKLERLNNLTIWLHGGRSKDDVFPADKIYTEDGSVGVKGLVTDSILEIIEKETIDTVYCCGPKGMMKHISKLLEPSNVELYVSLEEYMACGLGSCMGCAVAINTKLGRVYKTVCNDGPIFEAKGVIWDE